MKPAKPVIGQVLDADVLKAADYSICAFKNSIDLYHIGASSDLFYTRHVYNDQSRIYPDDLRFLFYHCYTLCKIRSEIHFEGLLNPASVLILI